MGMKNLISELFRGMEGEASQWGSDMAAHMPTLHLLAKISKGSIVECGVGKGFSTLSLISGAMETGRKVISYDISSHCEVVALINMGIARGSQDNEILRTFWDFRTKDSLQAAADFGNQEVGLWFLDTTHFEEETMAELTAWLPKMRPDGIMCGHDYFLHEHPDFPKKTGVKHAVDRFVLEQNGRFRLQVMKYDQGFFVLWPK